ncbi:MAG: L,D-transpeptidase family protein [Frankiales bacterium]|nr:L,D-transpeptidase family protein [Frankiales bacterium]
MPNPRQAAAALLVAMGVVTGSSAAIAAPVDVGARQSASRVALPDPRDLRGVHDARQLVVVTATGYGATTATVRVFRKRSDGWHRVMGPWSAWIGYNGFAARGAKREGDGRTPTGSFHFSFAFGAGANPGTRYGWRRTRSTSYWDDDSASANYNRWVDSRRGNPGRSPEPMQVRPYRLGLVIGYNTARTPGRGSAIFLHVTHYSATAGCVTLSYAEMHRLLRWLRPALHPRIIMGTESAVRR